MSIASLPPFMPRATRFRAGDWVQVRSKEEILRTLDANGCLEQMPFMPEMFAYCGRRLRVVKAAHKTCDTITRTGGRAVSTAVHLQDADDGANVGLRCDGQAHGGCEAKCLLFFKDAWLKPVDEADDVAAPPHLAKPRCTERDVLRATVRPGPDDGKGPTYACQGTEVFRASAPLRWWDLRQYAQDYLSGNVDLRTMAAGLRYAVPAAAIGLARSRPRIQKAMIAAYDRIQALHGGKPFPRRPGNIPKGEKTPFGKLDLKPGERVRVKHHLEILDSLDTSCKNRGLYFDAEHVPYCGGTYRVHSLVHKIVDENTGKMLEFKNPSVILDGVVCGAQYSDRRMFCPRAIYPYWREIWLERAAENGAAAQVSPASHERSVAAGE